MVLGAFASAESYPAEGFGSYKSLFGSGSDSTYADKFYAGLGYSYMDIAGEYKENIYKFDYDFYGNAATLLLGYDFNRYFAIEGRYSATFGDLSLDGSYAGIGDGVGFGGNMSNVAVYLKPQYNIPQLSVYALLGFGQFEMSVDDSPDEISENAFQWGLGLSFHSGEHFDIFLDYTRFYNDEAGSLFQGYRTDLTIYAFNAGLAYKF